MLYWTAVIYKSHVTERIKGATLLLQEDLLIETIEKRKYKRFYFNMLWLMIACSRLNVLIKITL